MKTDNQLEMFCGELDKLVHRFREEFDLPYASMVGALHFKTHALCREALDDGEEIGFELDDE